MIEPKEHPDYPNYLVYPDGRIWSKRRKMFLKPGRSGARRNYLNVGLGWDKNRKKKIKSVHRMVIETFIGQCPSGHECAHINGDSTDNRIENLRWVTPIENTGHQRIHGTRLFGSRHQNAKLSEPKVAVIKSMIELGVSLRRIAHAFRVNESLVSQIKRGKVWTHVKSAQIV